MAPQVLTLYDLRSEPAEALIVFRLVNGQVEIDGLNGYPTEDWQEVVDPDSGELVEAASDPEGFMQALAKQDYTYSQIAPGEPPAEFGDNWQKFDAERDRGVRGKPRVYGLEHQAARQAIWKEANQWPAMVSSFAAKMGFPGGDEFARADWLAREGFTVADIQTAQQ